MRKFVFSFFALVVFASSFFLFRAAWASAYEWITNPSISCSSCQQGTAQDISWNLNTSGNYSEYETAYYATTTSNWHEITNCRVQETVNGSSWNSCTFLVPNNVYGTGTIRVTTNYAGCGSWTPTPDVVSCGDLKDITVHFTR